MTKDKRKWTERRVMFLLHGISHLLNEIAREETSYDDFGLKHATIVLQGEGGDYTFVAKTQGSRSSVQELEQAVGRIMDGKIPTGITDDPSNNSTITEIERAIKESEEEKKKGRIN